MIKDFIDRHPGFPFFVIIVLSIVATFLFFATIYRAIFGDPSSLEAVTEARFILNDGQSVEALDYEVIIDKENGREYLHFPGRGITPFIDDNGNVLRVVE